MGCFSPSKVKSESKVSLPGYITDPAKENVDLSRQIGERPYSAYPYARIAPFSGDQNAGFDFLRGFGGNVGGIADAASGAATAPSMSYLSPRLIDDIPGQGPAAGSISDYMSSYVTPVLQETNREINRQGEIARNQIDAGFSMDSAFGDARHGIVEAEQRRDQSRTQADVANRVYQQAYESAMGLRNQDLNRGLSTFNANRQSYEGGLERALSGGSKSLAPVLQYVDALLKSGGMQQGQAQKSADLGYADFQRQFNYPQEALAFMQQILGSTPHGQTTTSTTPGPSKFGQIAGGLSQLGGMALKAFAPGAGTAMSMAGGLY